MKKIFFLLFAAVLVCSQTSAQKSKSGAYDKVFTYVEQMPSFAGVVQDYIAQNFHFPKSPDANEKTPEGKIFVKFVVNEDGSVSNAEVLRGLNLALDKEALRVVTSMPKWKPGMQSGKPVKVYFTLPITIKGRW